MSEQRATAVPIYLTMTLAISAIFYALIISDGHVAAGGKLYVAGLMWAPACAAFLTVHFLKLPFASLGLAWGGLRYALIGYGLPVVYALIAYLLIWTTGLGIFPDADGMAAIAVKLGWHPTGPAVFISCYLLLLGTTQLITSVAHALGEEIGWRGFLAPRLVARFGFTVGNVLVGLIWGLWHVPLLLFADYNLGTPWWFSLPCFFTLTIGLSVILTWLRLASKSVWPCAILHASHNLFIQGFFTPLTGSRGEVTKYVIDEFGVAVPLVALLFALGVWQRHKRLMVGEASSSTALVAGSTP